MLESRSVIAARLPADRSRVTAIGSCDDGQHDPGCSRHRRFHFCRDRLRIVTVAENNRSDGFGRPFALAQFVHNEFKPTRVGSLISLLTSAMKFA